jgi:hypothetical protein
MSHSQPAVRFFLLLPLLAALGAPAAAQPAEDPPERTADGLPRALAETIRTYRQARAGTDLAPEDSPDWVTDSFASNELARAKFEAVHADPRELVRQKLLAARQWGQARSEDVVAGREIRDILLEALPRQVEAELAVRTRPEDRAAALERGWEWAWLHETINADRYAAGRVPVADYAQTMAARLEAEIRWLRARAGTGGGSGRASPLPRLWPEVGQTGDLGPVDVSVKDLAEAKRAALRADPRELARQKVAALRAWDQGRWEEYVAGHGTLFNLLEAGGRLADAEADLADNPEGRAAALETHWAQAWQIEVIDTARLAAGRVPLADYLESRYVRLGAEARWLRARARAGARREPVPGKRVGRPWGELVPVDEFSPPVADVGAFARAKREALQTDPRDLDGERRAVAREEYRDRWAEFMAGRGTLDLLLDASRRWLDAELAVLAKPAERAAAWERYWARSQSIERINEGRYQAGRLSVADRMQSCYVRLDAEIGWAEARAAQEKK